MLERLRARKAPAQDSLYEFLSIKWILAGITLLPAAILFTFVNVLPILWAIYAGFFNVSPFSREWTWVGLENYFEVIGNPEFWMAMWRSLLFAAGSVTLQLIFGIGIALIINRTFRFATLVRSVIILPYLIPTAVLAFLAKWMGDPQSGILNQILLQTDLITEPIRWFSSFDLAMISVVLTGSWKFTLFVVIMVLARLQGIPEGLYEAATTMGATSYEKFRDITLPNLKGVIFIVLLLRGVWMFNKFDLIFVLTGGGPLGSTTTTSIHAYDVAFTTLQLGRAAAISTLLFIVLATSALLYFRVLEPSQEVDVE